MDAEHVIALLLLIAEMRAQIGVLSAENERLRSAQSAQAEEPKGE
jgi:uncharacterized small protein (DUF1192 family)